MEREYDIQTEIIYLEIRFNLAGTLDWVNFSKRELIEYRDWLLAGVKWCDCRLYDMGG